VVNRVPQQVHQRIAELVQDFAVELDLLAFHPERDLLAKLTREVAHEPGKRSNTCQTGVMRAWMISFCRSAERREM